MRVDAATFYRWESGKVPDLMYSTYRRVQGVLDYYANIAQRAVERQATTEDVLPLTKERT